MFGKDDVITLNCYGTIHKPFEEQSAYEPLLEVYVV